MQHYCYSAAATSLGDAMSGLSTRLYWLQGLGIVMSSAIVLCANSSLAQMTPDSTLPNNSNVILDGQIYNITGGTQAGSNLFHSQPFQGDS
jgi:large exoprotein involved in heme utilization and adhesion